MTATRQLLTVATVFTLAGLLHISPSSAAIDPASIVGVWLFDEGSGNLAKDNSGHGYDADLKENPTWVAGRFGQALAFGGGSYLEVRNSSETLSLDGAQPYSIVAWVKNEGGGTVVGKYNAGIVGAYFLYVNADGTIAFDREADPWIIYGTQALPGDDFGHVAATYDGTTLRIYVNGELDVQQDWGLQNADTVTPVLIGARHTSGEASDFFSGVLDEVAVFDVALTAEQIREVMTGLVSSKAMAPIPADEATDVPRDTSLSWTAPETAATHNVYFGTSRDDLDAAGTDAPLGVLVSEGQTETTYTPDGTLAYGQTYYWRIDEVNAAPDATIFKGNVWAFTTEPFAYPIETITATASSAHGDDYGPEKTIDGSGLDASGQHSVTGTDMWLSGGDTPLPAWIQYDFGRAYKMREMQVWNSNQAIEVFVGFGAQDVTVEYSTDGADWTVLEGVTEFAQASGSATYTANTIADFGGAMARFVRITINDNWGMLGQTGLSEVRFLHIPTSARAPKPANGAADVALDAVLGWRPGRAAAAHDIYLSTDEQAVTEGTALIDTVSNNSYSLASAGLEYGRTYYWKINEVNDAADPAVVEGDVWSFSTLRYFVVEDMESYDDDLDGGNAIFQTWIDGWENGTGATVGYLSAPFAEQRIVNSGRQSMPLDYNNVNAPWYSETERTWDTPQNWTVDGVTHLTVNFRGNAVGFLETGPNRFTMGAAGADIWGTADEFRYAYKRLNGDGSIVAKVESLVETEPWAKAGVMIRENLEPGSKHAMVVVSATQGVSFQRRLLPNDISSSTDGGAGPMAPYWVKITRAGNTFTAGRSADGVAWVPMTDDPAASSVTIEMIGNVYIGLAVTSNVINVSTTAEFSDLATTGNVTGSWQTAAIGVAQPANDAAPLYVALEDSAGKLQVVNHADTNATIATTWQEWNIPLGDFTGVNMAKVTRIIIGVGDRDNPTPDGSGLLYIDDIRVSNPAPAAPAE